MSTQRIINGIVLQLVLFSILWLVFLCTQVHATIPTWNKISWGIDESNIATVTIHPKNPQLVFVATDRAIYRSTNSGRDFKRVLSIPTNATVHQVYVHPDVAYTIYAATDAGLYESRNSGQTWQRIYYDGDAQKRLCHSVIILNSDIVIGTDRGLMTRSAKSTAWRTFSAGVDNQIISFLSQDHTFLYIATDSTIYRYNKETSEITKIFSGGLSIADVSQTAEESENTSDSYRPFIRDVFMTLDQSTLYLATQRGIYFTENQGKGWQQVAGDHLPLRLLNSIDVIEQPCADDPVECHYLLASTDDGAYVYQYGGWVALVSGLESAQIKRAEYDNAERIYAATQRGVYLLSSKSLMSLDARSSSTSQNIKTDNFSTVTFDQEPDIATVHRWAIQYAQVDQNKIRRWQAAAAKKALMPSLSVGLDRSSTDLTHWDTGPSPDVLLKGRDYVDWDVSLSWNLGELIWNNDQTSIDSRSKLLVELREEIIDQVTRLYFERRRLQISLAKVGDDDPTTQEDYSMRISELTALLDGYTNGEFSGRRLENKM